MLFVDSSRPISAEVVPQRLWLSDSFVRRSEDVLNQQIDSFDHSLVMFLPIQIVFPSLFRERDVHESSSSFLLKTVPFSAASMDAIRRLAFAGLLSK